MKRLRESLEWVAMAAFNVAMAYVAWRTGDPTAPWLFVCLQALLLAIVVALMVSWKRCCIEEEQRCTRFEARYSELRQLQKQWQREANVYNERSMVVEGARESALHQGNYIGMSRCAVDLEQKLNRVLEDGTDDKAG